MVAVTLVSALVAAGLAAAVPTAHPPSGSSSASFSLPDGFPDPNPQQLLEIERQADGLLSNLPPPPKLASSSLTAFQLIKLNEDFEVAFFASLLRNITSDRDDDDFKVVNRDQLAGVIKTVLAQEELHSITAKTVLENFGAFVPLPCVYKFPTQKVADAIQFAETQTAVVLGTLQDASQLFAKNGDDGPVRAVASVIGQEGEQNGFYRLLLGLKPSEKPFLTTNVAPFAFSALVNNVIVSCPFPLSEINLPLFAPLAVESGNGGKDVEPRDQTLTFSVDIKDFKINSGNMDKYRQYYSHGGKGDSEDELFVTYFTGQQIPISEPISNVKWDSDKITFDAFFPFEANIMEGLSIASLTTKANITDPDDVPNVTLAAPAFIQVNDRL